MQHEHKLPPEVAAYAKQIQQQLGNMRQQYLLMLGQAKETEQQADVLRNALQTQLAMVQQAAKLPESSNGWNLSADGTALVGEVADAAAATVPEVVPGRKVNGSEVRHGKQ